MNNREFWYSLRIAICPDFYTEEKFEDLIRFCHVAKINDVMFIINAEEVNQGHLTYEETQRWLDMLEGFRKRMKDEGIRMSLNPWTTLLHTDRGRKLNPALKFGLMEDAQGHRAEAAACPLDERFRKYLRETYEMYGRFGFYAVWVEDDFRLHNHMPLNWGGCFCPVHMEEFSRRAGHPVTADEMLEGITRAGTPHPYRKIWLDTARDTMNDLAAVIGEAVHGVAPESRVGLMSSAPEVHCIEGRDWETVLDHLSGDTRPLNRPHLPAYWEAVPRRYALEFQRYSRLSAAMTKGKAELWPELDNLPHTTFSKSHRFACMEMESSLSLCSEGITINIFDMIGNGINWKQKNEEMLAKIKPYLNGVKALHMKCEEEAGIRVMYSPRSAYTLHTDGRKQMEAIQPWETFWAEYLAAYGIACTYCDDWETEGQIIAVGGQYFRNLNEEQIRHLFQKNIVLLEGEAAETLSDLGLGELAGIKSVQWYPLNGGRHSYEQAVPGEWYQGMPEPRISAQAIWEAVETGDYLCIEYDGDVRMLSVLRQADGSVAGPGLTICGNTIIFPYGHMRDQYNFLLNPVRQEMLQKALEEVEGQDGLIEKPAMIRGCQYVTVNDFRQDKRRVLFLTNYSTDDPEEITVCMAGAVKDACMIARETGEEIPLYYVRTGKEVTFRTAPAHMQSCCIVLKTE